MASALRSLDDETAGFDEILAHLDKKFGAGGGMNVCLAVDGSRVTEKATKTMLSLLSSVNQGARPLKTKIQVLHVFDQNKSMPRHLTPERVIDGAKTIIEASLGTEAGVLYTTSATDKSKATGAASDDAANDVGGTCDTLMRLNDDFNTDLLVLGAAGVNESGINILGSVSHGCLRSSNSSIMLIKSTAATASDTPTQNVYVLSTDGSEASRLAAVFLSFLVCDDDIVHVVHVNDQCATENIDEDDLLKPYAQLFQSSGNVTFEVIENMYSTTVASTIVDYAVKKDADFIVMGISGYGKQKLGSVSSKVCRETRCSTIVVKDPRTCTTTPATVAHATS